MELTNNVITIFASILVLITSAIGLYEKRKQVNVPLWKINIWRFLLVVGVVFTFISFSIYELNSSPSGYVKTVIQGIDENGNYEFEQTQSYFIPWSLFQQDSALSNMK